MQTPESGRGTEDAASQAQGPLGFMPTLTILPAETKTQGKPGCCSGQCPASPRHGRAVQAPGTQATRKTHTLSKTIPRPEWLCP